MARQLTLKSTGATTEAARVYSVEIEPNLTCRCDASPRWDFRIHMLAQVVTRRRATAYTQQYATLVQFVCRCWDIAWVEALAWSAISTPSRTAPLANGVGGRDHWHARAFDQHHLVVQLR